MKALLLIASIFVLTSLTWAQQGGGPPKEKLDPANIFIDLRCVSLPQAQALPIVRNLRSEDPRERAQAITELDEMVAKETATLLCWLNTITHPDQNTHAEEMEEVRYATEFEPPSTTYNFAAKEGPLVAEPKTVDAMAPMATAFDTRNTGFSLEVKPTLYDDTKRKSVDLEVVASHVWLKLMEKMVVLYENAAEKRVEKTTVEQPRFMTTKAETHITMESGDHQLIGLFRAPEGKNQFELFILGVEVRNHK